MSSRPAAAVLWAALLLSAGKAPAEAPKVPVVEDGRRVSIEYTLTLDDGTAVESNVGGQALVYEQGAHQIPLGLEEGLAGMAVSESKRLTLPPEKGFGPVEPELVQEIDPALVPEDARRAGAHLAAQDVEGNLHRLRVIEVREDKIVVDANHPLAGRTVHYDVKVLGIE